MAQPLRTIMAKEAPVPLGHYSHAVHAGDFLFISGMIPFLPGDDDVVDGSITEQTHQVITNIETILREEGLDLTDIVKTTVMLRHIEDYADMHEVYAERFGTHKPARTTAAVAHLPRGVLVLIESTAYHPQEAAV